jgi:LysR family transcriptional regulator, glycine cleavage system transcriptional activator
MDDLPSLNGLRAFEAAARHLSFARAAEELHVSPAAVSHQIRTLEDQLGVQLFRRLNRAVVLTEAGALAFPGIRGGFEELRRALRQLDKRAGGERVVVVTVAPAFASKWLVPRLAAFIARYPEIDLRIGTTMATVDLASGQADVAVRYNLGNNDGLVSDKLLDEVATPMCRPELLDGSPPLQKPADLANHTLIHDDSLARVWPGTPGWTKWLARAGLPDLNASGGPHFEHSDHCIDAAIAGSGVVLGRKTMARRDLELGYLVAPFDIDIPFPGSMYSVTTLEKASNPNVRAFRDWLLAEAVEADLGAAD